MGNVWTLLALPCVTVEFIGGAWVACEHGVPIRAVGPGRSSDQVKRAVWEYFDRRVNL